MSSKLPRKPDPEKWVTTKKVEKQPTQRPLIDPRFRAVGGIATPPSTARKRSASTKPPSSSASTRKRSVATADFTPTAPSRNIEAYFTPPTTGPVKKSKAKARAAEEDIIVLDESQGAARDWAEEGRAFMAALPSPPTPKTSSQGPHKSSDVPPSSMYQMTQVPDTVLARHRRLCGQDSARRKAVSPWRRQGGEVHEVDEEYEEAARAEREAERKERDERRAEERQRKRLRLDERDAVTVDALHRTREIREKRVLGEFKSLVHLTSSSATDGSSSPRQERPSSPSERPALAQKEMNTMSLRRHSSAVQDRVTGKDAKWPQSSKLKPTLPAIPSRSRRRNPISPKVATPRKQRPLHHKVTPPKSRTPVKYGEQQETLFVFPERPPQPVFLPKSPKPVSDWSPVEMEPETLMTWSLGGERAAAKSLQPQGAALVSDDVGVVENDDGESLAPSVLSQSFPHLVETLSPRRVSPRKRRSPEGVKRSPLRSSVTQKPPPAEYDPCESPTPWSPEAPPRQSSYHTVPSSFQEESPVAESPSSPSPPVSPSPRKAQKRRADQTFRPAGFFSSISGSSFHPSASNPKPGSSRSTRSQTRSSKSTPRQKSNQSKLEAFGYFHDRRETADFDNPFSDEENLDFGEEPLFASPSKDAQLGRVPDAPPHPSLRKAGIRELERREAEAMSRHLEQSHCHPETDLDIPQMSSDWQVGSTDASSSLEGLDLSPSTRDWWDKLGDRDVDL